MMPIGTIKRKIKWEDVVESNIIETPKESRLAEWSHQLASLEHVVSGRTPVSLHLRLKNNEEITIGCNNPDELQHFLHRIHQVQNDQ
jgi:hypothetical protein